TCDPSNLRQTCNRFSRGLTPFHPESPALKRVIAPGGNCATVLVYELAAAPAEHPWKLRLARLKGTVDYDGFERVSTQSVLDVLEIPQNRRNSGTYRVLSRVMGELGWSPIRLRALTRGAYLEQVRGYCRVPSTPTAEHSPAHHVCG